MASKEEQELDRQFQASMATHPVAQAMNANSGANPNKETISPATSAGRGFNSGLMFGFQPQAAGALAAVNPFDKQSYSEARDEAAQRNDAAFQTNPYSYGAGYAGGALAPTLVTGGLSGATNLARTASFEAAKKVASRMTPAVEEAVISTGPKGPIGGFIEGASNKLAGITQRQPGQGINPGVSSGAVSYARQNLPETAARVIGGAQNTPAGASLIPQNILPSMTPNTAPLKTSQAPEFGSLKDWLASAQQSNNPDVTSMAQRVASVDPQDDQEKRRAAMAMMAQGEVGRAVGNEDSPHNT